MSDALTVIPIWKIGPAACVQRGPVFYFSTPGGKHPRICDLVSRIISKETEHEAWTIRYTGMTRTTFRSVTQQEPVRMEQSSVRPLTCPTS